MHGLLRSVWNEPSPPDPPQRVWRDWVLVGLFASAALVEGVLRRDLPAPAVSTIVTVGLTATLLWRRTRPLPMVVVAFLVTGAFPLLAGIDIGGMYSMVFVVLLPYALFRWGSGREAVIGVPVMLCSIAVSAASADTTSDLLGAFAVMITAMALGVAFRYRAGARARELAQVKMLEREQLARDLHDIVAHHVSAMAIRAQAGLATAPSRPEAATDALRVIEAEAARTLAEMRAMVRVLRRNEPAELTPGHHLTDLEHLAGQSRFGPSVEVSLDGDLDDVPASVGAAIYRIAQESVTNARRHAEGASRIRVDVTADATTVRLRVSDDGEPAPPRTIASPGYGIIGMIERASLLGGTCEAGPAPDGGWTVTAVLPRSGEAR
ncbi:sensor histidine kinase [Thermopolyspora sp. NPDC052614]|uniref:sensor histidine kinase n=1 Tax=Thermopolyspora sp. NPDC052614 TaxID=3155682 RepID=UPI003418A878